MDIIFWVALGIVVFTYLGYGVVVALWLRLRGRKYVVPALPEDAELPRVSLLIAAYNEADILPDKVTNCHQLDYPSDKLDLIFVTDGSSDESPNILQQEAGLIVLHHPERRGKIAAVKRAMHHVTTPITVLTDANTFLNADAIRRMITHFQDPTVGAVAGEKRVISQGDASSGGEGLYWRYESFLKQQDSDLYSVVGAAGELYAIRTELYHEVPADTILDDFMHTLLIAKDGYRVTYAPDAIAEEHASANVEEELKRKVRICAGGFQSMRRLLPLLNIFKYGTLSFQYIGHRVLRWTLAPLCLPIVLLLNIALVVNDGHGVYTLLLLGQILFYSLVLAGYLLKDRKVNLPGFFAPYYFFIMNYSVYAGFFRYLKGQQRAAWEKAKRASISVN